MDTGEFTAGGKPAMDQHPIRGGGGGGGGVEILLVTSCYENRDKLWPDGPLGSRAIAVIGSTLVFPVRNLLIQGHAPRENYTFPVVLSSDVIQFWRTSIRRIHEIKSCNYFAQRRSACRLRLYTAGCAPAVQVK